MTAREGDTREDGFVSFVQANYRAGRSHTCRLPRISLMWKRGPLHLCRWCNTLRQARYSHSTRWVWETVGTLETKEES